MIHKLPVKIIMSVRSVIAACMPANAVMRKNKTMRAARLADEIAKIECRIGIFIFMSSDLMAEVDSVAVDFPLN